MVYLQAADTILNLNVYVANTSNGFYLGYRLPEITDSAVSMSPV